MTVEYEAKALSKADIMKAVQDAGYKAIDLEENKEAGEEQAD
ncbi:hypothetical protein SAMN04488569_101621 [Marinilactibacillus piezotolerans]|uniref:HMA domain-containing protein n=1 Tax=Marinilactibacillus piezotolerans TaxID=258723 RepID=A0A1I3XQN7_9LACT|nr:hypothetical protein SAMN04488569_101621 [Marinilactibacillus piezotolerans]